MHGSGKELGVGIRSQQDQERSGIELMAYRIVLTPDTNDTFLAECPAFPEVVTFGETEEDAKRHASLAIQEAIARRMHDGQDVPPPDGAGGATEAPVPLLVGLQVDLYRALRESGLTRAELARRLGWNRNSVDRLFDVNHASRLEQIEAALGALGYRIDARLTPA
jgi:antitoxin HicB